jgi:hypothetical protein
MSTQESADRNLGGLSRCSRVILAVVETAMSATAPDSAAGGQLGRNAELTVDQARKIAA